MYIHSINEKKIFKKSIIIIIKRWPSVPRGRSIYMCNLPLDVGSPAGYTQESIRRGGVGAFKAQVALPLLIFLSHVVSLLR